MTARTVVVGSGIIGACSAYYLASVGHSVTLLDRGQFGAGCSHSNCGFVCPSHVLPLAAPGAITSTITSFFHHNSPLKVRPITFLKNLRWFLGFVRRCNSRDMLAAGRAIQPMLNSSRELYEQLITTEQITCEWERKGLLFVFRSRKHLDQYSRTNDLLESEFQVVGKWLDTSELAAAEPALLHNLAGGFLYEHDAHLRPDKLMNELKRVLLAKGVAIQEHCSATGFMIVNGAAAAIRTEHGELTADNFVVAAGAETPWLNAELGCRLPIIPGKGYTITMRRPTICPRYPLIFEEHRVAVTPFASGYRLGSTMEFAGYDSSLNRKRLTILTEAAKRYLQEPLGTPIEEEWWGWRPMTCDGLPIIDRAPAAKNVMIAAGHNMLGLSMAPATGKLVAELLSSQPPHIDPTPYMLRRFNSRHAS